MDTGKVMVTQNNRTIPTGLKMYGDSVQLRSAAGVYFIMKLVMGAME